MMVLFRGVKPCLVTSRCSIVKSSYSKVLCDLMQCQHDEVTLSHVICIVVGGDILFDRVIVKFRAVRSGKVAVWYCILLCYIS